MARLRPWRCMVQVLIQNGYLLEGTLCKKTLGASGGSLIHVIFMEAGPEAARAFLSQCQCALPMSSALLTPAQRTGCCNGEVYYAVLKTCRIAG